MVPAGAPDPPDQLQQPLPAPSEGAPAPTGPYDDGYAGDYYLKAR